MNPIKKSEVFTLFMMIADHMENPRERSEKEIKRLFKKNMPEEKENQVHINGLLSFGPSMAQLVDRAYVVSLAYRALGSLNSDRDKRLIVRLHVELMQGWRFIRIDPFGTSVVASGSVVYLNADGLLAELDQLLRSKRNFEPVIGTLQTGLWFKKRHKEDA
jgi:hypothetical protein